MIALPLRSPPGWAASWVLGSMGQRRSRNARVTRAAAMASSQSESVRSKKLSDGPAAQATAMPAPAPMEAKAKSDTSDDELGRRAFKMAKPGPSTIPSEPALQENRSSTRAASHNRRSRSTWTPPATR